MFNIMVVEDDKNARKLMETVLSRGGYTPISAEDGEKALEALDKNHVDCIILDIMMPNMDGYEFLDTLRGGGSQIPCIMVTSKETAQDKHRSFRMGVDDYMVKPVDEEELLLRIAALLRRSQISNEHKLVVGGTTLDYDTLCVIDGVGVKQELPKKEFLLLFKLLSYQDKIFTRRQLMDELWDMESESDERTVDVHINRLRERFGQSKDFDIVTVRGLGYKAQSKNK